MITIYRSSLGIDEVHIQSGFISFIVVKDIQTEWKPNVFF